MILIIGRLRVAAKNHESFMALARELVPRERQVPGCVGFEMLQDLSDSGAFLMLEQWRDRDALNHHLNSEGFARNEEALTSLLDGEAVWEEYEV